MLQNPPVDPGKCGTGDALHRCEAQFHRLLEKLPAGAYTCDPEGLITYFNRHAVELWGREPKVNDPVDRYCGSFRLFSTDGAPIAHDQCWMALALKTGREFNGREIVIEHPDGRRRTALAHANPFHDGSGQLLGAVNVLVDISERKRAEEALKDADRAKNEFLATLAHELRNPLAPIRNAVELLRNNGLSTEESEWTLAVIDRQTQQLSRLVDDLLDIARITSNKLELRTERIELADVVRAAMETSQPLIKACDQEFTLHFPAEPIHVRGDFTRLAQAIANLLNNAAKYTDRGGRISLTAARQGDEAVVTVRDTGIGMPGELIPRIFEMFTQLNRSMDRSQGGLGIGLTLVKRIVEMHGGTTTAHSDGPGAGSEFVIRLPVAVETAAEQRRGPEHRNGPSSALRILLVDDNRDSAITLGKLLHKRGHQIRTAHDGLEAIDAAEDFRPDAAVLDIGLPKLSGYDAARRIREQPWGKEMVLIAATGWGQDEDRQRSREAGFDHHLVKPVNLEALIELLAAKARSLHSLAL